MARTWWSRCAAALLLVGLLAGCGGAKPAPTPAPGAGGGGAAPPQTAGAKYRVGMVTDIGGINDESFNAASWSGIEKASKENGYEAKYVESKRQEEYEPNFQTLIDQKYNFVWGIGFLMGEATTAVAQRNPTHQFGIIDAQATAPNVASVLFREEEGSFLMGVIAAKTTKSKKIGFIGGMPSTVITHFEAGFKAGVKAVDPSVTVATVYAGAFDNPGKGKEVALSMIAGGADVLFHAAGLTGTGMIQAAKERNVYAIGVDQDQSRLAPQHVISSMLKRVDVAIYDITKQAASGQFPGGKVSTLGLKENAVGYASTTLWDKMPAGTRELVDKWVAAIKAGTVTVPSDLDKLKSWQAPKI